MTPIPALEALRTTMQPDWRYRWRTEQSDDGWTADVQAGNADASWRATGACPIWTAKGSTQAEALDRAVASAIWYWSGDTRGLARD